MYRSTGESLDTLKRGLVALTIGCGACFGLHAASRQMPEAGYAVVTAAVALSALLTDRRAALLTLAACLGGLTALRYGLSVPSGITAADGVSLLLHAGPSLLVLGALQRASGTPVEHPTLEPGDAGPGVLLDQVGAVSWEADWEQSLSLEGEKLAVRRISPRIEALLGHPSVSWLEEPDSFTLRIHPEDRQLFLDYCSRCADGECEDAVDYRLHAAGGSWMWVRHWIAASPAGQPGLVRLRGLILSIAERKEAEEALRSSEEWYRRIVDTASEGLLVLNAEFRAAYMNQRLTRLMGCRAERLAGLPVTELIAEDDRAQADVFFRNLKPGHSEQRDFRLRRADGGDRWVLVSASAVRNEKGAPVGCLAMITDVTERRQAEEALRFLARASSRLSLSLDHDATIATLSDLALSHMGDWCAVDLLNEAGEPLRVAAGHRSGAAADVLAFPRVGGAGDSHPIRRVLTSGRPALFSDLDPAARAAFVGEDETAGRATAAMVAPLAARGRILGAVTIMRTERAFENRDLEVAEDLARRAAVALDNARLYSEVQQAGEAKDHFLAMLAHELRNPLAAVRNAVEVLRRPAASDARRRALDVADRQLGHQVRMVDDLLDVSRSTRGKIELRRSPVDLVGIVRDTARDFSGVFNDAGITLRIALPDYRLELDGDATRLSQVVGNLLQNALKFTDDGGSVSVRLTHERDGACLTIADTGIGIDPATLPRVFDTFAQADQSLARTRGGLGLGLALVKALVECHGGSVHAASRGLGHGAEFTVRLPVSAPAPRFIHLTDRPGLLERKAERSTHRGGTSVLVIEDLRDAAETMRDLLELEGHEVELAENGEAGLQALWRDHPDVVLCDIGLPEMDGYEVARRVREGQNGYRPFMVAVTGYGLASDRERAQQAGFDAHLIKPVRPEELFEIVRKRGA